MASNHRAKSIYRLAVAGTIGLALVISSIITNIGWAVQTTTTHRPDSSNASAWPVTGGTPGGTCTGNCDYVDEALDGSGNGDGDGSYIQNTPNTSSIDDYNTSNVVNGGQRATNVKFRMYWTRTATQTLRLSLRLNIRINGTLQTEVPISTNTITTNGVYQWAEADFAAPVGGWTTADINTLRVYLQNPATLGGDVVRVSTIEAKVTWDSPALDQSVSRAYTNADSTQPGAALAATNTAATVAQNTAFRVRMGVKVSAVNWLTGTWGAHNNQYKLQYAAKSTSACSTVSSGWTDVSSSTAIRWKDNATPADGATISSYASDPDTGASTKVYQTYEEANPFALGAQTDIGNTAIWDFSLQSVSPTPGLYCLRILQNDGSALTSYTAASYQELAITGNLTVFITDSGGTEVPSPSVSFANHNVSTNTCQTSSGTLGTSSQRIRITNDLADNGWTVSMAATSGTTGSWLSGSDHYDFNDPGGSPTGCTDSGDADAYAGQLVVSPAGGTVSPKSGCTSTGVSLGSTTGFNEGTTDSVTLISATSSSQKFCYWDVTGIGLDQKVPKATPKGTYSLDMTITVTAL